MKRTRRKLLRNVSALATGLVGASAVSAREDYPEWDSNEVYTSGDTVVYDGAVWEAQWWTRGDEPGSSEWGPWEHVEDVGDGDGDSPAGALEDVVPKPFEVTAADADYEITADTTIVVDGEGAMSVGEYLANLLGPATGFDLPVEEGTAASDAISLQLGDTPAEVGNEGYELSVAEDGVTIRARTPAGLFWGVQSLRQVLPAAVESDAEQSAAWTVPGGDIVDDPRFEYRGAHFDVARHFFGVEDLERYIDYLAQYKINHFHIHLTDDQGWRIEIESWPQLTEIGGSTEVGGGDGGYYTQEEYTEIVEYARDRFITVVPEIDVPGHTNAALASYAELNCDGEREDLYTGIEVGFSSLCVDKEVTYEFVDDVIREVSDLTPGPYLHIGGDEADTLSDAEYEQFMDRVVPMIQEYGKRPVGWHQIFGADPPTETIGQYWAQNRSAAGTDVAGAAAEGHEIIASPASHAYLDMKYDYSTDLGLDWAGPTSVREAYEWDPGSYITGVDESQVMGPEAALWSETLETFDDVEFMLFPRLPAVAELGWTSDADTEWTDFSDRLAQQGPRWEHQGINFYRSDDVSWPDG